jgi:hypothetical protein
LFTIGKLNENVAPLPSALFSAHILPLCASTMPFEISRPSPEPASDLVTNIVNNFSCISGFNGSDIMHPIHTQISKK